MNTDDNNTTTSRPFGFWVTAVDRLLRAEFATVFDDEGITRRDWRMLNRLDGTVADDRPLRGPKLRRLVELGWVQRTRDGWKLTDAGTLAKQRLSTAVDELDLSELNDLRSDHEDIRRQIGRQIVGQDEVVEQLLMAVFARGHCILEGVPGLAKTLMVVQVALSLVLLVGAGLFIRTLRNLQEVDIGFNRERLLLFSVNASANGATAAQAVALYGRMRERFAALPGVQHASFSRITPLAQSNWTTSVTVPRSHQETVAEAAVEARERLSGMLLVLTTAVPGDEENPDAARS